MPHLRAERSRKEPAAVGKEATAQEWGPGYPGRSFRLPGSSVRPAPCCSLDCPTIPSSCGGPGRLGPLLEMRKVRPGRRPYCLPPGLGPDPRPGRLIFLASRIAGMQRSTPGSSPPSSFPCSCNRRSPKAPAQLASPTLRMADRRPQVDFVAGCGTTSDALKADHLYHPTNPHMHKEKRHPPPGAH